MSSYYVAYRHPALGQRKSSNWQYESDARRYWEGLPEDWRALGGGVVWTQAEPDIFRHCGPVNDDRNPAQAIGGKCFTCGRVLTRKDAKQARGVLAQ